MRAEWEARPPTAEDARVELTVASAMGGVAGEARVVSHLVDGLRHYGAVFVPDGAPQGSPALVLLHAGGSGTSLPASGWDYLVSGLGGLGGQQIYVIPSFRSEPLTVGGRTFRSEGTGSPWDRDVDDALALLEAAIQLTPRVDPARVAAVGASRGGLVALLMAARGPRIGAVAEFSGPTDFFDGYVRTLVEEAVAGSPRPLVGLDHLDARYIQPWVRGELSTATLRLELVRRSAVLFAADLPRAQVHHGTNDPIVAVSQAQSLISALTALGRTSPEFEGFLYQGAGHDLSAFAGARDRLRGFLEAAWSSASASADLRVANAGPASALTGDPVTYVITTRNDGPQAAADVVVLDSVPAGVSLVSATRGATLAGREVRWPALGALAPGAEQVDTLVLSISSTGPLTTTARATSATPDPAPVDNRAQATTNVASPTPDLDGLFAPPTASEIATVQAEWAARQPSSTSPTTVKTMTTTTSGVTGEVRALSHVVDGHTHYGSVFVPDGLAAGAAPIVVFLHSGEAGTATPGPDLDYAVATLSGLARDFVYVFPSFRSEPLHVGADTYVSGGPRSFWDRDADDALALVEVVRATVPEADTSRIAALGVSRGGLVALLTGIRSARVDGVVTLMSLTDFFDDWVRAIVADLANGLPPANDFEDYLNQEFIQPWVRGEITLGDMRRELVRRSAVLFASDHPWTQIHHGTADATISVSQADALIAAMDALGRTPPAFEAFLYEGAGHDVGALGGSEARIRSFFETLWP